MGDPGIEAAIRELADKEAIRDLARRYAHYVWRKDASRAISLFAEDGVMEIAGRPPIKGTQALGEAYKQMLAGALQPFVHNHVIELNGDSATGTCYLDLRATMNGKSMIGSGCYDDHYVRVGSAWKFRSRKLTLYYLVPLSQGWAEGKETSPDNRPFKAPG
jgi:uncharacterized protein (TIGR02246 family)